MSDRHLPSSGTRNDVTLPGPAKPVEASRCVMNEIVLPNDTNGLGNLMGGRLLHLMDVCAAISAQRHANCVCVTAAVDSVDFHAPIPQSSVVILESQVNRAFRTSMEVEINVWAENPREQSRIKCNRAYFTFVAIGSDGHPQPIPPLEPRSVAEKERYEAAGKRREFRHILSGRIELEEATELLEYLRVKIREVDAEE